MKSVVHELYTQFEQVHNPEFNDTMGRHSFSIPFNNGYAVYIAENTQHDVKFGIYSENESYDYVLVDAINIPHQDIDLIPSLIQTVQFAEKNEIQRYGITEVAARLANKMDRIIPEPEIELCR